MFCTKAREILAPIKNVVPTNTEIPSTHSENGKVIPGIETGGPMFTAALAIPNCNVPPKKLTPELTRVPGTRPKLDTVAMEVSNGLQRIFGQCMVVNLAMLTKNCYSFNVIR